MKHVSENIVRVDDIPIGTLTNANLTGLRSGDLTATLRAVQDMCHEALGDTSAIADDLARLQDATEAARRDAPIPMRLPCPSCGALHIDEGEFASKPHHTHACQECGMVWRPAVVHTVGVRFLPGYRNPVERYTTVTCENCLSDFDPPGPGFIRCSPCTPGGVDAQDDRMTDV